MTRAVVAGALTLLVASCSSLTNGRMDVGDAGPPLIEGVVVDMDGDPVATDVSLHAWPADDVVAALESGQAVPITDLAEVRTGRDGCFALRLPADAPIDELAAGDGIVVFEVRGGGPAEGWTTWSMSAERRPEGALVFVDDDGEESATFDLQLELQR